MPQPPVSSLSRVGGAALLWLAAGLAQADTFRVGSDAACTHSTIQAAIDAAAAIGGGGIHLIVVANNGSYTNQALVVDAASLHLAGGFSECSAAPDVETDAPTALSGAGNGGLPVLSVQNPGEDRISVTVENFDIGFGGGGENKNGGGIRVRGAATLALKGARLHDNQALSGGGIHVEGRDAAHGAEVTLEQSRAGPGQRPSVLERNRARAGGGIFVGPHAQVVLFENAASVLDNEALSAGGVLVAANAIALFNLPSGADFPPAPGLQGNRATSGSGGGLLVQDGGFASVDQGQSSTGYAIRDNQATAAGGGIFAVGENSSVILYAAHIEDNRADADADNDGCGGGLHARNGAKIDLSGNESFLDCPDDAPCASLSLNQAALGGGACVQDGGTITVTGTHMRGNSASAGAAILSVHSGSRINLDSVLISESNLVGPAGSILSALAGGRFSAMGITLADNLTTAALVEVMGGGSASFIYSILHQPGRTALNMDSNSNVGVGCVLSHEAWPIIGDVRVGAPLFANPEEGDYRLTIESPAVDACVDIVEYERDLHSRMRGIDLAQSPNQDGPYDLGAFELQSAPEIFANGFEPE